MKKSNGITLIALVITIIVLLILAGVSISAISGENGIVAKAKEAAEKTEASEQKELETLSNYESQIDKALSKLNEYGFYFDTEYICYDYWNSGRENDIFKVIFRENNTIELHNFEERNWPEGESYRLVDFANQVYVEIESLEYNKVYSGTGIFNSDCSAHFDNEGNLTTDIIINSDNVEYISNGVNCGNGSITLEFYNDGTSFLFNGNEFSIIEE